jgi:hypothetical protein
MYHHPDMALMLARSRMADAERDAAERALIAHLSTRRRARRRRAAALVEWVGRRRAAGGAAGDRDHRLGAA